MRHQRIAVLLTLHVTGCTHSAIKPFSFESRLTLLRSQPPLEEHSQISIGDMIDVQVHLPHSPGHFKIAFCGEHELSIHPQGRSINVSSKKWTTIPDESFALLIDSISAAESIFIIGARDEFSDLGALQGALAAQCRRKLEPEEAPEDTLVAQRAEPAPPDIQRAASPASLDLSEPAPSSAAEQETSEPEGPSSKGKNLSKELSAPQATARPGVVVPRGIKIVVKNQASANGYRNGINGVIGSYQIRQYTLMHKQPYRARSQ